MIASLSQILGGQTQQPDSGMVGDTDDPGYEGEAGVPDASNVDQPPPPPRVAKLSDILSGRTQSGAPMPQMPAPGPVLPLPDYSQYQNENAIDQGQLSRGTMQQPMIPAAPGQRMSSLQTAQQQPQAYVPPPAPPVEAPVQQPYLLMTKDQYEGAINTDKFMQGPAAVVGAQFTDRDAAHQLPGGGYLVRKDLYDAINQVNPMAGQDQQSIGADLQNVPANVSAEGAKGVSGLSQMTGEAVSFPRRVLHQMGRMFPTVDNSQVQTRVGPQQPGLDEQAAQKLQQFGDYLGKGADTLQQDNPVEGEVGKLATGMGTLAIDAAMGELLGPAAFTASFAARSAGTMYRQAKAQGDPDAFGKAMTAGFTAALTPAIAHIAPAEATQPVIDQIVKAYVGTGSMVYAQSVADKLLIGSGHKIDLEKILLETFPEAATQGAIGVAMHGAANLKGTEAKPPGRLGTAEPGLTRPDSMATPELQAGDYGAGLGKAPPEAQDASSPSSPTQAAQPGELPAGVPSQPLPTMTAGTGPDALSGVPTDLQAGTGRRIASADNTPQSTAKPGLDTGPYRSDIPQATLDAIKAELLPSDAWPLEGESDQAYDARIQPQRAEEQKNNSPASIAGNAPSKTDTQTRTPLSGSMTGETVESGSRNSSADYTTNRQPSENQPPNPDNQPPQPDQRQQNPAENAHADQTSLAPVAHEGSVKPRENIPNPIPGNYSNSDSETSIPASKPGESASGEGAGVELSGKSGGVTDTTPLVDHSAGAGKMTLAAGDVIHDEGLGRIEIQKVERRKDGSVLGHLIRFDNGRIRFMKDEDIQRLFEENPYIDAATGERKFSPPATVERGQRPAVTSEPPSAKEAAKPEPAPDESTPTSIKNRIVDQERAKRGLEPVMKVAKRDFGTVWDGAMREIDSTPGVQDKLIAELKKKPRALTDHEDALLLHRQIELQNQFDDVNKKLVDATDKGDDATRVEMTKKSAALSDELLDVYNVGKAAGTESGRGLNARRMMANEDFSLAAIETRRRAANDGKPLTEKQHAEIKDLHERIAKTQKAYDDYVTAAEAKHADLELRIKHAELTRESAKPQPKRKMVESIVLKLEKGAEASRSALKDLLNPNTTHAAGEIAPKAIYHLARIAAAKIARGGYEFSKFVSEMAKEFGDKIKPHLAAAWKAAGEIAKQEGQGKEAIAGRLKDKIGEGGDIAGIGRLIRGLHKAVVGEGVTDREKAVDAVHEIVKGIAPEMTREDTVKAMAGYGEFKQLSKDAIDVETRRQKGELLQLSKLDDLLKGQPPKKTGVEQAPLSDEGRKLAAKVEAEKKRLGIQTTDPATQLKSALDARKTWMTNRIADLKDALTTGKPIDKTTTPVPLDAQAKAMKAELDDLNKQYADTFGQKGMTDEQRLKSAINAAERAHEENQRRIKENDLYPERRATADPKELAAAKDRAAASGEELKLLRNLDTARVEQEKIDRLTKTSDAKQEKIDAGDISTKSGKPTVDTEAVSNLRDKIAVQQKKVNLLRSIADKSEKLATGDFSKRPTRTPPALDAEGQRLSAENERVKDKVRQGELRDRLKNRSPLEKVQDALVKWRRAFVLSWPTVIGKLTGAAALRGATAPVEEALGGIFSKLPVLSKIAAKAPSEGYLSLRAEARAHTRGLIDGIKAAWKNLKNQHSDIETLYGDHNDLPREAIEYLGSLHAALKAPIKQSLFERSLQKRTESSMRNGEDITDPVTQMRNSVAAYADANRGIFMQDNMVSKAFSIMTRYFETHGSAAGKAAATGAKLLFPITKVPVNVVSEAFNYAAGAGIGTTKLIYHALAGGIKGVTPEQADSIMRNFKKGGLGAAGLLLGFFNPTSVGGYHQNGEKRDEEDVKAGSLKVYGVNIPKVLIHNPLMETLQLGSTMKRVMDEKFHRKNYEAGEEATYKGNKVTVGNAIDTAPGKEKMYNVQDADGKTIVVPVSKLAADKGPTAGAMAAALGLLSEVPYLEGKMDFLDPKNPDEQQNKIGKIAKGALVPGAAQFAADAGDRVDKNGKPVSAIKGAFGAGEPVKRDPQGIGQNVMMGVPGARQAVPAKAIEAHTDVREAIQLFERMSDADKKVNRGLVLRKIYQSKSLTSVEKAAAAEKVRAKNAG